MRIYRAILVLLASTMLLASIVNAQMGTATGYFVVVDNSNATKEDTAKDPPPVQENASDTEPSSKGAASITGAVVGSGPSDDGPGFFSRILSRIFSWFS